jgi:hypothetical protein
MTTTWQEDVDQAQALQGSIADNASELGDVLARIEAAGAPEPEPEPPEPPEEFVPMIGSSVNGPLFKGLGYSECDCTRVYLRSLPAGSTWTDIKGDGGATSDLRDGVSNCAPGGVLWLSYKEKNVGNADAFFDTVPEDVKAMYHLVTTWYHEPEDNETSSSQKDAYRKAWANDHGPMIRDHDMVPALVLMRYTLQSGSGRNWRDWYPGDGVVDITGWDCYRKNDAGANGPDAVASMAAPMEDIADETGTFWGIGETGATRERYNEADTAKWAENWRKHLQASETCALGAWWDQDAFTFTPTTAEAWTGYRPTATRHPRLVRTA